METSVTNQAVATEQSGTPPVESIGEKPPRRGEGDSLLPMILATLSIVISGCALLFCYWTYSRDGQHTEIYVIDMPAIIAMRFQELAEAKEPKEIMAAKVSDFSAKLDEKIKSLSRPGVVILSPEAVVTGRDAIDITDKVARSVGVTVSYEAHIAQQAQVRSAYNRQLTEEVRNLVAPNERTPNDAPPTTNLD